MAGREGGLASAFSVRRNHALQILVLLYGFGCLGVYAGVGTKF
jgi:hypothetical protein